MTDRVQSLTVILDRDIRDDDVQCLVEAIRMMRYVRKVDLGEPVSGEDYMARVRVGYDIRRRLIDTIDEIIDGKPRS